MIGNVTYSFLVSQCGLILLSTSLIVSKGSFALILKISLGISTIANVLNSDIDGLAHPSVDSSKNDGVGINCLFINTLEVLFDKAQSLIGLELIL